MVDPKMIQAWFELKPDLNTVDPKMTQTELRPDPYQTQMTQIELRPDP